MTADKKYHVKLVDEQYYRDNVNCQAACPVHTDASGYVNAVTSGDAERGYLIARQPNPFASVCGRVCQAPCEEACRRNAIDGRPITIRALKRYLTERHGPESPDFTDIRQALPAMTASGADLRNSRTVESLSGLQASPAATGVKAAVIGAGPAGLTAAHDLSAMGYAVTLFEDAGMPGGMLRLGIPEYRLPREVLQKEIDDILSHGVEVRANARLGRDFTLASLREEGYRAVFIATGAHRDVALGLPGEDLQGVMSGVEFLRKVNLGQEVGVGNRVAVIGGGNVAMDAIRTALRLGEDQNLAMDTVRTVSRLGAKQALVLYRRSREEMPASEVEIDEALEEGIEFHYQVSPTRIIGTDGRVTGIECVRMRLGVPDESGRRRPEPIEGSEFTLEVDTVLSAIGQVADLSFITPEDGIEVSQHGTIVVDPETLATTQNGVFAGGDVAFGPRIIIEAVRDGHRAARGINRFLSNGSGEVASSYSMKAVPDGTLPATAWMAVPHEYAPALPVSQRKSFNEVEQGFDEQAARIQSARCLRCNIQTVFDSDKCILCGGCVDVCPRDCYRIVRLDRITGDAAVDEVIEARFNIKPEEIREETPTLDCGSAILKDEDNCIRCGLCAVRCPTGAITMEAFTFREEPANGG